MKENISKKFRSRNLRGLNIKKLENGFGEIRFLHEKGSKSVSFKDYLRSQIVSQYLRMRPRAAYRFGSLKRALEILFRFSVKSFISQYGLAAL